MSVHPLHVVVMIIGVLFGLRHLDVAQRSAEQFPAVAAADFARWKDLAGGAYRLGMSACFGKVLLDIVVAYLFRLHQPSMVLGRTIGLTLEVVWAALVVLAYLRVRRGHKLAEHLGIEGAPAKQD